MPLQLYIYKQDLELKKVRGLICHKNQPTLEFQLRKTQMLSEYYNCYFRDCSKVILGYNRTKYMVYQTLWVI